MHQVAVLGAGRIGRCVADILSRKPELRVTLADQSGDALACSSGKVRRKKLDVRDSEALDALLADQDVVVSACQFFDNVGIAQSALRTGTSYFDLTEDVATTDAIRRLAREASRGQVFVPQCGLAPGYVGILGAAMATNFDELDTLKLRVGALPQVPSNAMLYNLTWSVEGLVNEYCNPCDAIKNGERRKIQALEGLETFTVGGTRYEAFNTSGGLGTLTETLAGRVRDLTYKTVRYPGHRMLVDFLVNGLRLGEEGERRELLQKILQDAVPVTDQDVVVILVSASGKVAGKLTQSTEYHSIVHGCAFDPNWSAIQISTASSVSVVVDIFLSGQLTDERQSSGFIGQEQISLARFMEHPWAVAYRDSAHLYDGSQVA